MYLIIKVNTHCSQLINNSLKLVKVMFHLGILMISSALSHITLGLQRVKGGEKNQSKGE
jgi:hypothetical protein